SRVRRFVHAAVPLRPKRDIDLTGPLSDPQMNGSVLIVPAAGKLIFSSDAANGPRFAFVLSGALLVTFADGTTEQLSTGDAMHLTLSEHMTWLNQKKTDAVVLCVTDPRHHP